MWPGDTLSTEELPCQDWDYDLPAGVLTALSEWNLVCADAWLLLVARVYTHLGSIVCAPLVGRMADRLGRKPVIGTCAAVAVAGAASAVLVRSFLFFVLSRMLVAASLGGFSLTCVVLLFEVTCEATRGHYICAAFLAAVLGDWLPHLLQSIALDRRMVAFAFLVPVLLLLLSTVGVPESSRWLLASWDIVGNEKLFTYGHQAGHLDVELDRMMRRQRAVWTSATAGAKGPARAPSLPSARVPSLASARVPSLASSTAVTLPAFQTRVMALSSVFFFLLAVLYEASLCSDPDRECLAAPSFWQAACTLVFRVTTLYVTASLLHRCDRKRALFLGLPLSCSAVTFLSLAVVDGRSLVVDALGEILFASLLVNLVFACVYSLELHPTCTRATGVSTVYFASALPATVLPLVDGYERIFRLMFGLLLAVGALFLMNRLPETRNGFLPETAFDLPSEAKRYSLSSTYKGFLEHDKRRMSEPSVSEQSTSR